MIVTLTIQNDYHASRKIVVRADQIMKVGRTEWADAAIAGDGHMSSVHFEVQCESDTCRIRDLDSANGTFVNGEPIIEVELTDGDQVLAGQTKFVVRIERSPVGPAKTAPVEPLGADSIAEHQVSPPAVDAVSSTPSKATPAGDGLRGHTISDPASSAMAAAMHSIPEDIPGRPYHLALVDDEAAVRHSALLAAAWSGQAWLLPYCVGMSRVRSAENWDALLLLAILGTPSHLQQILAIGRETALGPRRFRVLGAFGHPDVVKDLLIGMQSKDAETAAAAGIAFAKMTGVEFDSPPAAEPQPTDGEGAMSQPDLVDEAPPADLSAAQEHWRQVAAQSAQAARWCRGFDVSDDVSSNVLAQLDLESRCEVFLRASYRGQWQGSPFDLAVIP
ncbi:MAG: FHA domain-containing protein [Planctomycetes bacterium]|nr:FHA domain-containing protein [Planctomycetota bacterium]